MLNMEGQKILKIDWFENWKILMVLTKNHEAFSPTLFF